MPGTKTRFKGLTNGAEISGTQTTEPIGSSQIRYPVTGSAVVEVDAQWRDAGLQATRFPVLQPDFGDHCW